MKKTSDIHGILLVVLLSGCGGSHEAPAAASFGNETEVTITGYSGDAMEPFISGDGRYLFFNSLNTASDVRVYHAQKVSDTEFASCGELSGADSAGSLDAVPSMTDDGQFFWVTNDNYPKTYYTGAFSFSSTSASGTVSSTASVSGDFYIDKYPAELWTIMDAEISRDGGRLYYVNARYSANWTTLEEASIGTADKSGTEYIKNADTPAVFANINDPSYRVYAPSSSPDGRELFYTRILKTGGTNTEICRAARASLAAPFGEPEVLSITGTMPEAPSLSRDGSKLYYHKKKDEVFHIYMMTR
jgi:Tol biopolymer transport system component